MAAATVDVPYLSRFLSIPQPSLTASLEAPTVDLVASVLQAVAIKAREFDELKADKVRQEVELENAVRSGESRTRSLKASVEKGLKEVSELRAKLNEQENARATLENELQTIKNSSTTSTSELSTLRSRISSLESSNRDTVALLESKSTAHDRLAEELTTQHQKLIELRREISTLEQTVQTAQSASTTAKFRESNLEQELELLRKRNEWFETELQTKAAELTKTRKEKGARISELQRLNEDTNSTLDAVRRTESALRTRLEDVSQKADSAFAKIQQLQDNAAKQEEENRKELANAQRLAALYDSSLKTTKERLQEVEANQERLQDEAADEIGAARAETETERTEREAAETHVAELEEKIERLEADISALRNNVSAPGTPRRVVNGSSFLGRSGSPISAFSPGASRMKSASTNTELVAENARLKTRLAAAERHSQKLAVQLEDITQTLEEKGPEVQENESEKERLENEVVHLSSTLEHLGKERDKAIKDARKSSAEVNGLRQEGDVLRQQLRDLSAQVKVLLFQIHARDQNLDELSAAEQMQIERMAHGDLDEDDDDSVTPTSRLISERLATFKSIEELQAQNTRLLSLTRNLGEKMESEDARWQQNILAHAQEREELESLRTEVQTLQEDLKSTKTRFDAVARERDMFRRIVQTRGQASLGMSIGSAVSPSQGSSPTPSGVMQSIEHSSQSQETAEMAKMLKEMSQHFETYRNEAGTDLRALRQQSDSLAVEKSKIQSELNRCSTQLTLANERYEMLQANVNMLKTENSELQKRSQILSESASKQDLKSQQVAEELVEAKSMTDSMRSEISNLKAEKDLWKKIEKRLSEDNESLANERNRLNGLLANLQNLQNERERSDSDSRRKLQAQVEALESELQTTKRRLNDEVEDSKKASLRREYDHQQSQKRIDDLVSSLGWTREELAAAKTARDHLQVRNEELLIELKSAEERAQVLQPRPTARSRANEAGSSESARGEDGEEDSITKEQELAVEISELKRDLELARSEIENQKAQIEQYKSISQAAEEELQNFNDAQEEYRLEMDRLIEEKDAKIRSLEERVEDISTELSNTNNELSALRNQELESSRKFEEMKVMLEAEIVRLKDEDERHATAAQFHQEDLKVQAEIAQQAQQNYETELVKHAEATQMLQKVRAEYNSLKVEVVGLRTEAEALRDRLVQKESSWEESKEGYERELNEMRTRREDVNAQNKLLHHQLESVGAQINSLKQRRADFGQEESPSASTGESAADRSVDELREVIRYLRREKEIVDVQYELSIQESKRMRQQLDYSQTQLDETRLKLDQERRSQADQTRSSITQNELIEKINELNVYRESSITLRNEARNAQAQLAEATKKIDELLQQIEPLETKIRVLESDKETTEGEMKLLQEDRNRWQQRTQNILQKYDRVDPAELESLKEQINTLQNERDALIAEKEPLQMQVESIPQQIKSAQDEAIKPWQEQREKFKERAQQALKEQRERLTTERFSLEEELSALKEELEAVKAERDRANASAASHSAQDLPHVSGSTLQNGSEDGQVNESSADGNWAAEKEALEERLRETEIRATSSAETVIKLESQAQNNQKTITRLENQITELQQSLVNVNSQLRQIQSTEQQSPQNDNSAEQLGQLQQDLAEAQKEVESLKANATINAVISNASGEDGSPTISQQAEQIQADLTLQFEERLQQAQDKFQARVDNMKTQLNSKLKSGRQAYKEETDVEHNTAIEQLKAEHLQEIASLKSQHEEEIASMKSQYEQEIASVKSQHQQEIEKLKSEEQTRLAQERAIWQAENAVAPASQATAQKGPYEPTDAEAKDLVANNATIRDIVRKNIVGALSKEKEALVAKVISEQEEIAKVKLEEAEKRAITTKEEAVLMESKRSSVKISMNENRAKLATAKLGIVEKAASETPERPVSEVWTIVRSFKPQAVVATSQQTATKQIPSSSSQKTTQPTNGAKAPTVPAPVQPPTRPVVEDVALARKQANINGPVNPPAAPHTETNSSLPNKPPQGQPANNAGTGPKALQGIVGQSGIPRGGAGQVRGMGRGRGQQGHQGQDPQGQNQYQNQRGGQSGLPRGGGRGQRGRGGTPNVRTDVPQISRESSPNSARGNLNAAARQFVPSGNKRPRDSEGGEDTGSGKRIRGGGAGS